MLTNVYTLTPSTPHQYGSIVQVKPDPPSEDGGACMPDWHTSVQCAFQSYAAVFKAFTCLADARKSPNEINLHIIMICEQGKVMESAG